MNGYVNGLIFYCCKLRKFEIIPDLKKKAYAIVQYSRLSTSAYGLSYFDRASKAIIILPWYIYYLIYKYYKE